MSCEVGPTGLSRLMTPIIGAGELPLAFGKDANVRVGKGTGDRAAGGAGMPAAAEGRSDGHRIGAGGGADADPNDIGGLLLEQDDDVRVAGQAQQVDESLRCLRRGARLGQHGGVRSAWMIRPPAVSATPARIRPHTASVVNGFSA